MHLYVIERPDGHVKIGRTSHPSQRINHLENQGGFRSTRAWVSIPGVLEQTSESRAHHILRNHRTVGEWFDVDFDRAVDTVTDCSKPSIEQGLSALDKLGIFIKSYGGSNLAKTLRVSKGLVSSWRNGRYPVPPVKCLEIQNLSKGAVKASELRPEIFGVSPGDSDMDKAIAILRDIPPNHRQQAMRMLTSFIASLGDQP